MPKGFPQHNTTTIFFSFLANGHDLIDMYGSNYLKRGPSTIGVPKKTIS
jgi:hypothetical protein